MTLARQGDVVQPKPGVNVSKKTVQGGLPIVRVIQEQSGDGTAGMFRRVGTGEEFETLVGTPLAIQEGRIKWETPFKGAGQGPECWSNNMLVADAGAKYAGRECGQCEWMLNGCDAAYAVVFLRLPERQEVLLTLTSGMSQAVGELIQKDTVRTKQVQISTAKVRGRLGAWYTLKIGDDMPMLPPEDQINIERYFRDRYLGAAVPVAQPEQSDELNESLPFVDEQTGEIIDVEPPEENPADYVGGGPVVDAEPLHVPAGMDVPPAPIPAEEYPDDDDLPF